MTTEQIAQTVGAPVRVFPYDKEQRKGTLLVSLGMLGLSLAFPALYYLDPVAVGTTVYLSPVVALIGLAGLAHYAYTRSIRLTVHQGGFVYGSAVVPFSRVRAIRYKLVHVMGGSSSYNRGFFHVRLDDGSKVSTSMQLERMDEAIGSVIGQTMGVLVEGITGVLRSGQVVRAGPFELHPQGIVCRGKSIAWARAVLSSSGSDTEMSLLDVDPDGEGHSVVHKAKLADIENADAIMAVAERFRVEGLRAR
jgi:hypothetical protein